MTDFQVALLITAIGLAYLSIMAGFKGMEKASGGLNVLALAFWFSVPFSILLKMLGG